MNYENTHGKVMLYQGENGHLELNVLLQEETVWLSLSQLVELFHRDKSVISRHIKNIFKQKELTHDSVVAFFATTAADGKTYKTLFFLLNFENPYFPEVTR